MGRIISSLIWIVVVLLPPSRALVAQTARLLWPSLPILDALARLSRWIPFVTLVIAAWVTTWFVLDRFVLPHLRREDEALARAIPDPDSENASARRGADRLSFVTFWTTIGWVAASTLLGVMSVPLLITAGLVLAGAWHQRVPAPGPRPSPRPMPRPPAPLPEPGDDDRPSEDRDDPEFYYRVYRWYFNETPYLRSGVVHRFEHRLALPRVDYIEFKGRPHTVNDNSDHVTFANADLDGDWVLETAASLRRIARDRGFDSLAEIHLVMAFTLSIRYALDSEEYGCEYPKFPIETLVDKRGDCEDHAILCGVLLHCLGHLTALVLMDITRTTGHAALAVASAEAPASTTLRHPVSGERLFYCEVTPSDCSTTESTTDVQWWLGIRPPSGAHDFVLYPITSSS